MAILSLVIQYKTGPEHAVLNLDNLSVV